MFSADLVFLRSSVSTSRLLGCFNNNVELVLSRRATREGWNLMRWESNYFFPTRIYLYLFSVSVGTLNFPPVTNLSKCGCRIVVTEIQYPAPTHSEIHSRYLSPYFIVAVAVKGLEAEWWSVPSDNLVNLVNPLHHLLAVDRLVGQQPTDLTWESIVSILHTLKIKDHVWEDSTIVALDDIILKFS